MISNIPGVGPAAYEAMKNAVNDLIQMFKTGLESRFGASVATPSIAKPGVANPMGGVSSETERARKRRRVT